MAVEHIAIVETTMKTIMIPRRCMRVMMKTRVIAEAETVDFPVDFPVGDNGSVIPAMETSVAEEAIPAGSTAKVMKTKAQAGIHSAEVLPKKMMVGAVARVGEGIPAHAVEARADRRAVGTVVAHAAAMEIPAAHVEAPAARAAMEVLVAHVAI